MNYANLIEFVIKVVRNKKIEFFFSSAFDRVLWIKSNEPCPAFVRYRYPIKTTPEILYGYGVIGYSICRTRNYKSARRNFNLPMFPHSVFAVSQHIQSNWQQVYSKLFLTFRLSLRHVARTGSGNATTLLSLCFYNVEWLKINPILPGLLNTLQTWGGRILPPS